MSDSERDEDLGRLATDLARSLRDLQRELEPGRRRGIRPPTPRELLRFGDEVAIPAAILVLETNIRALRLLQRTIRLTDPERTREREDSAVRDRAVQLSRTTVEKLDDVLADVQDAIEGRPSDDDARRVLDEARSLRDEIDDRLAADTATVEADADPGTGGTVPVDVDAELQSIRDDLDRDDTDGGDDANGPR